jgi:hypothetical protein
MIEGYCILTTQTGLQLVRINRVNLATFRNGYYERVRDAGTLLASVYIGDPYARRTFTVFTTPNQVSVWVDGVEQISNYVLPQPPLGIATYGFGPITSHGSHACEQLSNYTFSNIRMESSKWN